MSTPFSPGALSVPGEAHGKGHRVLNQNVCLSWK